ncbi:gamma-glutamylcyclotransferase family protein [Porticoccus sp. W117]|uniref:gamma-glutamylcyclotransferase family protein n=1 Tax=Porticoccus sp. W117 TaxID=3054777 RepID=UPI0025933CF2|nr:gamma-glutamylcyclotransferase family protein [Porticoccus sp. W117]MDM3872483.1 gamma-glutamylcyclotransferase family protein [Porticoccus sp. W117]
MPERRINGFFYGLFMDADLLRESQIVPENPCPAYVDDFELRIGQRATLVPAAGARSYGMVFALTHDDLDKLYSAPGLEHYRPEAVLACSLDGEEIPALCYNLEEAPGDDEVNSEYAKRLRTVLEKLGFPAEYIASVC